MKTQEDSRARDNTEENEKASIYFSFLIIAILNNLMLLVLVAGAQDILAGTNIQTSVVLLAGVGPYAGIILLAPYFIKPIPYVVRFLIVAVGAAIGFAVLGLTSMIQWKLPAIVLIGFISGTSDMNIVGLTSYFNPSVLAAYSTGTGAGMVLAPLYYTAMTTWFCVSPNTTLLIVSPMSLLFFLCYYLIQKEIKGDDIKGTATREEIYYAKIQSSDDEDKVDVTKKKETQDEANTFASRETLTWKEKLLAIKKILVIIGVPVLVSWCSEYIFLQSVVTTIAYPNAPFSPRDHYQYYFLVLLLGEVLGRSHRSLIGVINPKWLYVPTAKGLWALSFIVVLHLLFAILESWYRFLPGIEVIMLSCLTLGTIIGSMFANFLQLARISFEEKEREFVMNWVLTPTGCGTLVASLIGLYVEPHLREHCITVVTDSAYCFTRTSNAKTIIARCQATMP